MTTYRDAIDYLVTNDGDYVDYDGDGNQLPSVCVSMVSSLFNKTTEKVIEDIERAKNALDKGGNQMSVFVNEMKKLGMKKLKLRSGYGYEDIFHMSLLVKGYSMHACLQELTMPFDTIRGKYSFVLTFYNGPHIFYAEPDFNFYSNEIDYKKMSQKMAAAVAYLVRIF